MLANYQTRSPSWSQRFVASSAAALPHHMQASSIKHNSQRYVTVNANMRPQHVLSATAEMPSPAVSPLPFSWQEPLETVIWQASTACYVHAMIQITTNADRCLTGFQGSESEAKKRLPGDMSPPWKVITQCNVIPTIPVANQTLTV